MAAVLGAPLLRLSLHRRIAVFVTSVVLAVALAFAYLGWQALSQSTAATLEERQATAVVMARHLDDFVGDAQSSLLVVATELVDSSGELDLPRTNDILGRAMLHVQLFFANLILLTPDGEPIAVAPAAQTLQFTPAARAVIDRVHATQERAVTNRLYVPVGSGQGVLFVVPVVSHGRLMAILIGSMTTPHPTISSIATSLYIGRTGHMEVLDSSGQVLARAGLEHETETEHPDFYMPLLASRTAAVGRGYSDQDSDWHVMAFAPLANAPWGVGVGQTEAETFAPTVELRDRTLATAAVALALTLAFAWVGTQSVVKPIRALTSAGERMATGDLSQPIRLLQPDEIGRLAYVLETVRLRLRQSLEETAGWNHRLEERVRLRTRELERTNRHLHAMMAVATAANAGSNHLAIMQTALHELVETLHVRGGWVSLYDEDQKRLRLVTAFRLPTSIVACESVVDQREAACLQAVSSSQVVCASREACAAACAGNQAAYTQMACWIAPIRMDEQPLGVLCLLGRRKQKLDEESRELLSSVAQQVAMALQKARLADERARYEALRRLEVLRAEFLASVSHELRTPLGFIKGYATTLLRQDVDWQPQQQQEFLQIIDEETDHLTELVDSVLDVARAQAGRMRLNVQPVDAADMVRRSVARANGVLGACDVRVTCESPVALEADRSRLEQVILNLLVNAAKYSPGGGPIDMEITQVAGNARITVLDRGVGITSEDAERMFEPFYRAPGDATANVGGAGLGLAVCRAIVAAHGGQIWAEAREGGGTGVYITLPASATHEVIDHAKE